jgi:hypothetical protein
MDAEYGTAFLCFVRHYHCNVFPTIKEFFSLSLSAGRTAGDVQSHDMFDVVSNQVRNALDHLGRASDPAKAEQAVELRRAQLAAEIRMAEWHLDLAKMRALQTIISCSQDLIADARLYLAFKQLEPLDALEHRHARQLAVAARRFQRAVIKNVTEMPGSKEDPVAPPPESMAEARRIVEDGRRIATQLTDFVADLWEDRELPKRMPLRREMQAAEKRATVRRWLARRLGWLVGGIVLGVLGNWAYEKLKMLLGWP